MDSIVLKLNDQQTAGRVKEIIKANGGKLEVAPMSSELGEGNFDKLLIAGEEGEIITQLKAIFGSGWKKHVIQGNVDDQGKKEK